MLQIQNRYFMYLLIKNSKNNGESTKAEKLLWQK